MPGNSESRDLSERDPLRADVLLVTVNEAETTAVLEMAQRRTKTKAIIHPIGRHNFFELGVLGGVRVFLVRSGMGTGGPRGSQETVRDGLEALCPSSVVGVGIACGLKPSKQKIGDILISRQMQEYDFKRVGTGSDGRAVEIERGDKPPASGALLSRFECGQVLSKASMSSRVSFSRGLFFWITKTCETS